MIVVTDAQPLLGWAFHMETTPVLAAQAMQRSQARGGEGRRVAYGAGFADVLAGAADST